MKGTGIFICLLLLLGFTPLYAQWKLEGRVAAAPDSASLAFANVVVWDTLNNRILAFAQSDYEGKFALSVDTLLQYPCLVTTSFLGYRADSIYRAQNQEAVLIMLQPQQQQLRGVQVVAKQDIAVKEDTTVFNAENFQQRYQPSNLKDLLEKMPYVRFDEDGDLYFKHKRVENILLDGEDLFGSNYQQGAYSINPELLAKIRFIENVPKNQLLKGLDSDNKVVIDLRIKRERLGEIFGNLSVGGSHESYLSNNNLFRYGDRSKSLVLVQANNIGNVTPVGQGNIAAAATSDKLDQRFQIQPILFNLEELSSENFFLSDHRYNFNDEYSGNFTSTFRPNQQVVLRSTVQGVHTSNRQRLSQFYNYRQNPDFNLTTFENTSWKHQSLSGELELMYTPDSTRSLLVESKTSLPIYQTNTDIIQRQSLQTVENLQEKNAQTVFFQSINLQYTHRKKKHRALITRSAIQWNNIEERNSFNFLPPLFFDTRPNNSHLDSSRFNQFVKHGNMYVNNSVRLLAKFGYLQYSSKLSNDYIIGNANFQQLEEAEHRTRYTINTLSWNNNFAYKYRKLNASLDVETVYLKDRFKNQLNNQFFGNLQAVLNWQVTRNEILGLNLQQSNNFLPLHQYFAFQYFTDFRNVQQGSSHVLLNQDRTVSINYIFSNLGKRKMTLLTSMYATRNPRNWGWNRLLITSNGVQSFFEAVPLNSLGILGRLEALVYPIRGNLRLDVDVSRLHTQNIVNQEIQPFGLTELTTSLSYVPVLSGMFSLRNTFDLRLNFSDFSVNEITGQNSFWLATNNLIMTYRWKGFFFELKNSLFLMNSETQNLLDARINYAVGNWSFELSALNIFNTTEWRVVQFIDLYSSTSLVSIRPTQIILNASFTF